MIDHLYIFVLCAFCGWIVESSFRSVTERAYINSGFLFGPFIPIYGFGGVIVYLFYTQRGHITFFPVLVMSAVLLTVLEYLVSLIFEGLIGKRLWDYSREPFNIHGRVCLLYSFFWVILIVFVWFLFFPAAAALQQHIDSAVLVAVVFLCLGYMLSDLVYSITKARAFVRMIRPLSVPLPRRRLAQRAMLSEIAAGLSSFMSMRYFLGTPAWLNSIMERTRERIERACARLSPPPKETLRMIRDRIFLHRRSGTHSSVREFYTIVGDIIRHDEVRAMRSVLHHNRSSRYRHVMHVAYWVYRVCRSLRLDHYEAARAAVLHDFFLYDWRSNEMNGYPWRHPEISLANAQRYFKLTVKQKEIITHHMWPIRHRAHFLPRYPETWVIIIVDKLQTILEYASLPLDMLLKIFYRRG